MIEKNISLKDYCSYKTGGEAQFFASPADGFDLRVALKFANDNNLPVTLLGTGCNVLISDRGVKGLVISTRCLLPEVTTEEDLVYAGAGVNLDTLITECIKNRLGGLEKMSGIPGSVGGAVFMNAGAFGAEIKDTAAEIDICSYDGQMEKIKAEDAGFSYRRADNIDGIVAGVLFKLKRADRDELMKTREEILAKRAEKQPLEYPSCGSVFKRPEGNFAGALIEKCGLKGFQIGRAVVSEKHANFILNLGGAKSADIHKLILHVQDVVKRETGVKLEREVRFVGF